MFFFCCFFLCWVCLQVGRPEKRRVQVLLLVQVLFLRTVGLDVSPCFDARLFRPVSDVVVTLHCRLACKEPLLPPSRCMCAEWYS